MTEGIEGYLVYGLMYLFGIGTFVLWYQNMPTAETMAAWTFLGADFVASVFPALPWLFLLAIMTIPTYYIAKELS